MTERIAEDAARREAERQRIEAAAKARAEQEANAKLEAERQRIRDEEAAKARAEESARAEAAAVTNRVLNRAPSPAAQMDALNALAKADEAIEVGPATLTLRAERDALKKLLSNLVAAVRGARDFAEYVAKGGVINAHNGGLAEAERIWTSMDAILERVNEALIAKAKERAS